jgi:hypothetical protein
VICATALAGALASTSLRGLHLTVAGVSFGPYDTIIGVGGLLFVVGGFAAWPVLRRPVTAESGHLVRQPPEDASE